MLAERRLGNLCAQFRTACQGVPSEFEGVCAEARIEANRPGTTDAVTVGGLDWLS